MGIRTRELAILLAGDIFFFFVALWITLAVRYLSLPNNELFYEHLVPFAILSLAWIFVFYIAGLYDKHTIILKRRLFDLILNAQLLNILLAAVFFFAIPYFGIAPKTNLAIYLVTSSCLILLWRLYLFHFFAPKKKYKALIIAEGEEAEEVVREVNNNNRYDFTVVRMVEYDLISSTPDFQAKLLTVIEQENISIVIADPRSPYIADFLPTIFNLTFLHTRFAFLDFHQVYEDIFDRIPLSCLRYDWFLANVSQTSKQVYDILKRLIDILGSIVMGAFFLVLLPFVYLAIKLDDGGEVFITQRRIGKYNRPMTVYKVRTMTTNKSASAEWTTEEKQTNKVTRVGTFLRTTSIDELPQMLNILKGELSLIGPRNDIEGLGVRLAEAIPYYNIRYFITPGVTGWAQTNQRYAAGNISPQSIEESRVRLAYDLYYIKNRSFMLDISIALRTIKTLLSRFGVTIRIR